MHGSKLDTRKWIDDEGRLAGVVEVDEAYFGGKESNKHTSKKIKAGRGAVGKKAVLGMRERGRQGKGQANRKNRPEDATKRNPQGR